MLAAAIANGLFREAVLVPLLHERAAHAVSTILLCTLIAAVAWRAVPWIAPRTKSDAWRLGVTWGVLTVGFEFLGGHYLFGTPWMQLLDDWNVMRGRLWPLVLVATVLAPSVVVRLRPLRSVDCRSRQG
jgi:hypothetical protein